MKTFEAWKIYYVYTPCPEKRSVFFLLYVCMYVWQFMAAVRR